MLMGHPERSNDCPYISRKRAVLAALSAAPCSPACSSSLSALLFASVCVRSPSICFCRSPHAASSQLSCSSRSRLSCSAAFALCSASVNKQPVWGGLEERAAFCTVSLPVVSGSATAAAASANEHHDSVRIRCDGLTLRDYPGFVVLESV